MTDQYTPFKTGLISHTVESCGLQDSVSLSRQRIGGIALIEGQRVPGCSIYLGNGLSGHDGFAVIFHMVDGCPTLSSYEYGDLVTVIANIEALIENGLVADAYILAMEMGDGRSSLAFRDPRLQGIINGLLADIECELLSSDPRQSMDDSSSAVKLSEFLMAESGDWVGTSRKLVDALVVTILDRSPLTPKVDTAEAVISIRKALINGLKKVFK